MIRSQLAIKLSSSLILVIFVGLICIAVWVMTAGAQSKELPYVDLSRHEPLPAVAPAQVAPLRMAVAAVISPQGTFESYSILAAYLGEQLGRPVQLVQRRTYAEVNGLIERGEVDLAFVCTSAYVNGNKDFGMELLVAPEVENRQVYYSVLIVPVESKVKRMADLQGKVFAFTDPMSHSGRVYPTYLLQQSGNSPEEFFGRTFFTYSHDKAIEAVAKQVADGAAVDSLVLNYARARDPALARQIKVIYRSPPFGIPPVVVPPDLSPHQKAELRRLLIDMAADGKGRQILTELGFDRFTLVDDSAYNTVRKIIETTEIPP